MDTLSLSREVFKTLLQSELLDKSIVDKVEQVGQERSESNQQSFANFAIPQPHNKSVKLKEAEERHPENSLLLDEQQQLEQLKQLEQDE